MGCLLTAATVATNVDSLYTPGGGLNMQDFAEANEAAQRQVGTVLLRWTGLVTCTGAKTCAK